MVVGLRICHGFSFEAEGFFPKVLDKVAVSSQNPSVIYAAAKNKIFFSKNEGIDWKEVNLGLGKDINTLKCSYSLGEEVFVATNDGLFKYSTLDDKCVKIFSGWDELDKVCLDVGFLDNYIFLATKQGLYYSVNKAESWQKVSSDQLAGSIVSKICVDFINKAVFVACQNGIYMSRDKGNSWSRIFVIYSFENPDEDFSDYDTEITQTNNPIKTMYFSTSEKMLYIVTNKAIYYTKDLGRSWQRLSTLGLPNFDINSLLEIDGGLVCVSKTGVYKLEGHSWSKLDLARLSYITINDLSFSKSGNYLVLGTQ